MLLRYPYLQAMERRINARFDQVNTKLDQVDAKLLLKPFITYHSLHSEISV